MPPKSDEAKKPKAKSPRAKSKPKTDSDRKLWEASELATLLRDSQNGDYELLGSVFAKERIYTRGDLQQITPTDLVALGLPLGTRNRVLALANPAPAAPTAAAPAALPVTKKPILLPFSLRFAPGAK